MATGVAVPDAPGETEEGLAISEPFAATSSFGKSLNREMRTGTSADWRNERKSEGVEDDHSNFVGQERRLMGRSCVGACKIRCLRRSRRYRQCIHGILLGPSMSH